MDITRSCAMCGVISFSGFNNLPLFFFKTTAKINCKFVAQKSVKGKYVISYTKYVIPYGVLFIFCIALPVVILNHVGYILWYHFFRLINLIETFTICNWWRKLNFSLGWYISVYGKGSCKYAYINYLIVIKYAHIFICIMKWV